MYAIKLILQDTAKYPDKIVNIRTDSMWTMKSLTLWYRRWNWNNMRNSSGNLIKHAELIKECIDMMKNRHIKFLHTKSHVGIYFNELADRKAAEGAEIDKILYNL